MKGRTFVGRDLRSELRPPICVECDRLGVLTSGAKLYPDRPLHPNAALSFYVCVCGARVGCHPGGAIPLGLPCNESTARARDKLHRTFDLIWRRREAAGVRRQTARDRAYKLLARKLGMKFEDCHIGRFDRETCERALVICRAELDRADRG